MPQKIHDFRNTHTVAFNIWHFVSAVAILVGELTIHVLEMHMCAITFAIGLCAKDIITDIIEKCDGRCGN